MKKLAFTILITSTFAALAVMRPRQKDTNAAHSQSSRPLLDRYGGLSRLRCTNKTGHFILTKLGNRWLFCDPAGNGFISMSVGAILTNGNPTLDCQGKNTYPIYLDKYRDTSSNWGWQTLKRMTNWGFNSVGQDSGANTLPWQTCSKCVWPGGKQPVPLPYITELRPGSYAAVNRFGSLTEPIKDEINGTNSNYASWRGGALFDVFDPKLDREMKDELSKDTQPSTRNIRSNNPYLLGVFTDDSDWFTGSGAGPDFSNGKTTANTAWITLITSPVHTYVQSPSYGHSSSFIYKDTKVYSKALSTNPTSPCSTADPCSLRDYLWQKYNGNIANLNKAWRANYTTFDSTGMQITGEAVGIGDGVTRIFTSKLAHVAVSPYSVLFFVRGEAKAGDCPWFHLGCGLNRKDLGSLGSPTANYISQTSSTINYSTGYITITFVTPPAVGTAITVNYIYGGWMAGGTGLMDEDGSHTAWVGSNVWCLEGPNPNYPAYFACAGGGGNHEPVPNANPNLGADLDNWISQWAAKYFKTMHDDLKAVSKVPYLGLDTIGAWGGPAYSKFLEGASPYLDGAFVTVFYSALSPAPAAFQSAYQYTTQYLGDVPLLDFVTLIAEPDSSMSCHAATSFENFATQSARGQEFYNSVSYLLGTPGHNGTFPFVGFNWWSWQDFQGTNQGLVSIHDNAYDGHEAVIGTVPCSPPLEALTCGGEAANYGDLITHVKQANALWYQLLP